MSAKSTKIEPCHAPSESESACPFYARWNLLQWILLAALIGVLVGLVLYLKPASEIVRLREYIRQTGAWAPLIYIALYVTLTVLVMPCSPLTAIAGALFGPVMGSVYASLGVTLGSTCAFLTSRYLIRDRVARWVEKRPRFMTYDRISGRYDIWLVAGSRLIHILPTNVLNYALGITRARLWVYVLFSWLCMLPGTIMLVVGVDLGLKTMLEKDVPTWMYGIPVLALIVSIALGIFVKRKIQQLEAEDSHEQKLRKNDEHVG